MDGKQQTKKEFKKLFNYHCAKRRKKDCGSTEWNHKFFCFAYSDPRRIPTTDIEKDDLLQA